MKEDASFTNGSVGAAEWKRSDANVTDSNPISDGGDDKERDNSSNDATVGGPRASSQMQ